MCAEFSDPEMKKLCQMAVDANAHSYSPYMKFPVGAALLCKDGTIFKGCNVENASVGGTICAERTAVVKAVSEGKREFKAIAVCCLKMDKPGTCCGICRQFLIEFGNFDVYLVNGDLTKCHKTTTREQLPFAFTPDDLKTENK